MRLCVSPCRVSIFQVTSQSRTSLSNEFLCFSCWSTTRHFDEIFPVFLIEPHKMRRQKKKQKKKCSSAELKPITWDVYKSILPLGDWHCEHSPAKWNKDDTSSLLLLSLQLEIEKEYEAIKSYRCFPACISFTWGDCFSSPHIMTYFLCHCHILFFSSRTPRRGRGFIQLS